LAFGFGPKFITRELNIDETQDATIAYLAHKSQVTTWFEGLGFKECNAQILNGEFFTPHCLKFDFGS
jgi:hypothetical protein